MVSLKSAINWKIVGIFIVIFAVITAPFIGIAAEIKKKALPKPITTNNSNISIEELEYRLQPLTKDDLSVEADGWLKILKKHGEELSSAQIEVLKAKDDEKTKLLESVNKLEEQKTALAQRLNVVIGEYRSKGGKVDDYEAYIKAISGVDVKISDASATWTVLSGWLTSTEGGASVDQKYFAFFSCHSSCLDSGCFDQQSR
jgi:hypothetical protein